MTRQELLTLLRLLSALESWGFSLKERIPDYLHEQLDVTMKRIEEEILK